ncbi:MAG: two-component sensor histidine kinase, partial [Alphaproteobacteria bacterium]
PEVMALVGGALAEGRAGAARIAEPGGGRVQEVQVRPLAGGGAVVLIDDVSAAVEAERMRRDFIANVGHELRSPLTAIAGFIETLEGPAREDAAARARFLGLMAREAERMRRLIDDLLALADIERQQARPPTGRADLGAVVERALAALAPQAEAAGVRLERRGPDRLEVTGDADQLEQVVRNLVENAIKYGGSGGRVEVGLAPRPAGAGLAVPAAALTVRDFGPGIDPVHLPRLTERFYRADPHRSRAAGGTGLGLAIVKHILTRHRGRLVIRSEPGQGASFVALVPLAPEAPEPARS